MTKQTYQINTYNENGTGSMELNDDSGNEQFATLRDAWDNAKQMLHDTTLYLDEGSYEIDEDELHRTITVTQGDFEYIRFEIVPVMLDAVMTTAEVTDLYGFAEATVRQAINRGQLQARKSGGTWLVAKADVVAKWGQPTVFINVSAWYGEEYPVTVADYEDMKSETEYIEVSFRVRGDGIRQEHYLDHDIDSDEAREEFTRLSRGMNTYTGSDGQHAWIVVAQEQETE